ncbi:MAG: hypothetical protein KJ674_02960 [Nanoarchaeota archaeon]|nr:hypothetical protein [Nanoarchaeota archaeon]
MVKNSEVRNKLKPKDIETFFDLLFKYLKNEYRQFNWKPRFQGNVFEPFAQDTSYSIIISIYVIYESLHYGNDRQGFNCRIDDPVSVEQFFPIEREFKPREMARMAGLIFKWMKSELKSIKSYNEEAKYELDPKYVNVFFNLLLEYLEKAYKEYEWIGNNSGKSLRVFARDEQSNIIIDLVLFYQHPQKVENQHSFKCYIYSKNKTQFFPIESDFKPKRIKNMARTICEWIKENA